LTIEAVHRILFRHNRAFGLDRWVSFALGLAGLVLATSAIAFGQNHKLIIQNGATFAGTGTIIVKDSIRNVNSTPINVTGKVVLSGAAQAIVTGATNGSLQFENLSVRGSNTKTVVGTIVVAESLNVLSGVTLNISSDTLRIGNLIANAGTLASNANTVTEYNNNGGSAQTILGGTFQGKTRLLGNSRKILAGPLTVDSLEHTGWGLTVNQDLSINGKAQIDSLIDVTSGTTLSIGANPSTIATLRGNAGTIQANSTGSLTFTNDATNGNGIIRTDNSTVAFQGNINSSGTLEATGSGTMAFGGTVSSTNYSFANGSTEEYNGGAQAIVLTNYGNLTLRNAGTKTFAAGTTGIGGTIALAAGATADATTNATTIDYNGAGAQTVSGIAYHNLLLSGARGGATITLANADTIRVAGTFTNSATLVSFANTNNTFEYNGSDQGVTKFTYFNLVLSGGGTKTVSDTLTANGDVAQKSGTAVTVNAGALWQIDGSLTTQTGFTNYGEIRIGS
jgi:hypothetical protein